MAEGSRLARSEGRGGKDQDQGLDAIYPGA